MTERIPATPHQYRGLIRKIDPLGRLVLPIEYRKTLGLIIGQKMEMLITTEDEIIIKAIK